MAKKPKLTAREKGYTTFELAAGMLHDIAGQMERRGLVNIGSSRSVVKVCVNLYFTEDDEV